MPKHMYLPELDGNIQEPPSPGIWHGYQARILRGVSDGIVVGKEVEQKGVSSVPDAWARPLLFQGALAPESGHPLRDRVVQEWRGLLSLLALYKLQKYEVEIVPVSLGQGEFARALERLLPAAVPLEAGKPYSWSDVLLIRYEGIPVGAFSPTTLVYTGTDYHRRLAATNLSLTDRNGYLAPPAPSQQEELRHVGFWVQQLLERLNNGAEDGGSMLHSSTRDPGARAVIAALNRLLEDWLGEMRQTLGMAPGERFTATEVVVDDEPAEVLPTPPFLERYRVYREVLRPLADGAHDRLRSDMLLTSPRNRSGRAAVVVITPRLLQANGRIWRSRRLVHLGGDPLQAINQYFRGASGEQVDREDLKPFNAIWIRPEKYFLTDTLSVTSDRAPLLADEWRPLNGEPHFLLPFRREILDFFSPVELREIVKPEYRESDGAVTFAFHLPVNGRLERIQKTYRLRNAGPEEGRIVEMPIPIVQLFPRYIDANWRRYYLLQSDPDRVTIEPVVPRGCRVVSREHVGAGGSSVRTTEITGDEAYPEALAFATGERAPAPLGLALVHRPPEPRGLAGRWTIGVDFGTSNTNVFRQSSDRDQAERWRFDFARYLLDATAGDEARRDELLEELFVPATSIELPVPTALRIFQDARKEHVVLDFFPAFSTRYEVAPNVFTDFKWEGDKEPKTKYYLESLLMLLLIEVGLQRVESVQFACSYPKSFSEERLERFKGEWEGVVRRLLDDEHAVMRRRRGVAERGRPVIADPVYEAEGIAAGEYFASDRTILVPTDRAMKAIAAVCLDVGGGSTDISIWCRNEIVHDASILLAGRQISNLLQKNAQREAHLLEALFSRPAAAALEEKRGEPARFSARLNVVLKREEAEIRQRLIDHADNAEVKWIRRVLAVEFGAIAFYTASLLAAADRRLGGDLARELRESGIQLHWGGNAAKLINWIDFGRYDPAGIGAKLLSALLYNALLESGIQLPTAGQKQSPGHKSEASGGLVVMRLPQGAPRGGDTGLRFDDDLIVPLDDADGAAALARDSGMVCGENIELEDGPVGYLDEISERRLFSEHRTRFRRTSLDRLRRFVDIVNKVGVSKGLLTDQSRIRLDDARCLHIANTVRTYFLELEREPAGKRLIEPVFVLEVKILLDLLQSELR